MKRAVPPSGIQDLSFLSLVRHVAECINKSFEPVADPASPNATDSTTPRKHVIDPRRDIPVDVEAFYKTRGIKYDPLLCKSTAGVGMFGSRGGVPRTLYLDLYFVCTEMSSLVYYVQTQAIAQKTKTPKELRDYYYFNRNNIFRHHESNIYVTDAAFYADFAKACMVSFIDFSEPIQKIFEHSTGGSIRAVSMTNAPGQSYMIMVRVYYDPDKVEARKE